MAPVDGSGSTPAWMNLVACFIQYCYCEQKYNFRLSLRKDVELSAISRIHRHFKRNSYGFSNCNNAFSGKSSLTKT